MNETPPNDRPDGPLPDERPVSGVTGPENASEGRTEAQSLDRDERRRELNFGIDIDPQVAAAQQAVWRARQAIDLDADERPAEDQATDFFGRPSDYHQLAIEIPVETDRFIPNRLFETIGAQAVLKYTPDQQPLVVEILRQIRGALGARITLTKLHNAADTSARPEDAWQMRDATAEYTQGFRDLMAEARDAKRADIAAAQGVPVDWVHPAPSPTGDTAWTITPPPTPTGGRHAKPDPMDRRLTTADIHRAHQARFEHSLMRTTVRTDAPTEYSCSCGETLTGANEAEAQAAWEQHRRERYNAALHNTHDHTYTGDDDQ